VNSLDFASGSRYFLNFAPDPADNLNNPHFFRRTPDRQCPRQTPLSLLERGARGTRILRGQGMSSPLCSSSVRKRPALFRALGRKNPPAEIQTDGQTFQLTDILKHDSWAATAIYQNATAKIVCKFNRLESIFGVPMDWLGRSLADRERHALTCLGDLPGIPPVCGPIYANGNRLTNAVGHAYIEGHPLARNEKVAPDFFASLRHTLDEMHRRGIAYVDLHKRENIIVAEDGRPFLVDFQIHFGAHAKNPLGRSLLSVLSRSDDYHLAKHIAHHRGESTTKVSQHSPWWIRAHRTVARPFRELRRRLLTWFRIRSKVGRAETEHFAEDAVRRNLAA